MQTRNLRRALAPFAAAVLLAACTRSADNPYSKIQHPPLVHASLHTVTLVSDDPGVVERLRKDGYTPVPAGPNYPASIAVEAALWNVPDPVAAQAALFMAPAGGGLDVRVLPMPPPAPAAPLDAATDEAFFKNVLGTGVPRWPLAAHVGIQAWTYFVDDVVAASKRLRAAGIAVVFEPVATTTAYLGDHRTMGIRAPDGTVIELAQSMAR
jgi:hypothetical protein